LLIKEEKKYMKKVGVVTYCYPKGLGLVGLTIHDFLSEICDFEIFPINDFLRADNLFTSYRAVPTHPDWERTNLGTGTLKSWIDSRDIIIVPEVITPKIINYCNLTRKKLIHIPMQEWVSTNPNDLKFYKKMDHIVCPVNVTAELLHDKLKLNNRISTIKWALRLPHTLPKEDEDVITFFLNAGTGGVLGRRYTDMQIKVFQELVKHPNWKNSKLILKSQIKVDLPKDLDVEYILGDIPYSEVLSCYTFSDVAFCVTKWEGIGYHILESLYIGVPVITTNAPPMSEWVEHLVNGVLIKSHYPRVEIPIKRSHPNIGLNWVRAALVEPKEIVKTLVDLGPQRIRDLKDGVHWNLKEREEAFINGWKEILECQ